jgi:hypothetical protein
MTEDATVREKLAQAIDTVEGGYEFLLAYAAQGRHTDKGTAASQSPRVRLESMIGAISALSALARELAGSISTIEFEECAPFLDALDRDAAVSVAAAHLVLGKSDISSQLIDNLNASIHLRALLADIFLIDEIFKS